VERGILLRKSTSWHRQWSEVIGRGLRLSGEGKASGAALVRPFSEGLRVGSAQEISELNSLVL
jgi:superfamily II DNA or RNA helicase